jgi:hypothetical protein
MSEVIGRLSLSNLHLPVDKSRFGGGIETRLELKRREAHRRITERMRLIADIEDALRQVRSKPDGE